MEIIFEVLPTVISSAGLTGSIIAAAIAVSVKKAKQDAERKREERLKLEILRLEGEEKLSALLLSILKNIKGDDNEPELFEAEQAYIEYLENSAKIKNEIIGVYTFD